MAALANLDILRHPANKQRVLDAIDAKIKILEAKQQSEAAQKAYEAEQRAAVDYEKEKARCADGPEGCIHWFNTWVWTYNPKLIGTRLADGTKAEPYLRFRLFPKQEDFVRWVFARMAEQEQGLCEKSRDVGVSYLCAGIALHQWLFVPGFKATFGSRKAEYVDKKDQPDSIFEKIRIMLRRLPAWMLPKGFSFVKHDGLMRIVNPETGATITGEGGEEMGRGGRSTVYFVDEGAFVPNAEGVEKALSGNTDVIIWVSSVNGMGNLFARKRHSMPGHQVFRLHYKDDPRKTAEWIAKKKKSMEGDPTAWASEYEIDYHASMEDVCIPALWIESCQRLAELEPRLQKDITRGITGLDVGAGKAKSVSVPRWGPVVGVPKSRGSPDTIGTAHWALENAKNDNTNVLAFDAPGVGSGVSSALLRSEDEDGTHDGLVSFGVNTGLPPTDRVWGDEELPEEKQKTSKQMFGNLKAELWWLVREAAKRSHEHVLFLEGHVDGIEHPVDELLALPKGDPESDTLASQLPLVKRFKNEKGKIVIETKAQLTTRGIKSPDYAEALVLTYADPPEEFRWYVGA